MSETQSQNQCLEKVKAPKDSRGLHHPPALAGCRAPWQRLRGGPPAARTPAAMDPAATCRGVGPKLEPKAWKGGKQATPEQSTVSRFGVAELCRALASYR